MLNSAALTERFTVAVDADAPGDIAEQALAAHMRALLERLRSGDDPDLKVMM